MTSYLRSVLINASTSSIYDDLMRTSFLPDYHIGETFCSTKMVTNDVVERQGCFFIDVVATLFFAIWFYICAFLWTIFFLGHRRRRCPPYFTNKNDDEDCNEFKTCDILAPTTTATTLFDNNDDNKDAFSDDDLGKTIKKIIMVDSDADDGVDDNFTRLLASVYQPFVDIASTVLTRAERMMNAEFDGDLNKFIDDFLQPAVDLLCRVQKLTKTEFSRKNKRTPIGWPLCTNRRVIVHLGNLVVDDGDPDIFNGRQLESGDFYVSVDVFGGGAPRCGGQRTIADANGNDEKIISHNSHFPHHRRSTSKSRVALILHYYDDECNSIAFKEITLSPVDFVNLFAYLTLERENFENIALPSPTATTAALSLSRLKFRRYLCLTSNGQLDIMPLIAADNDNKQKRNNLFSSIFDRRRTTAMTFFDNCGVQNEEYFTFTKPENVSKKSDQISNVDDDVDEKKVSELPNLVDFTLTTVSSSHDCAVRRRRNDDGHSSTNDSDTPTSSSSSNDNVVLNSFDNLTKHSTSSFIGRCPRKLSDVRDQLMSNGSVRYTGTITWEECRTCAVEVLLTEIYLTNVVASDLVKAFVYLHYVHKSSTSTAILIDDSTPSLTSTKKFPFVFLVDCRKDKEIYPKAIRLFAEAVNLLKILRPNVTCELILIDADESMKRMLQECTSSTSTNSNDIEIFNIDELYAKLAPSQLSEEMGGERKYDGVRWVQFRKDLESFMDSCRMAAKFYINAIQRLKKLNEDNSSAIIWSMSSDELTAHSEKLRNDLNYTNQADATLETLFVGGAKELSKLDEFVQKHESVPHYKEAVTKVTAFFDEVHRVMLKYQQSSERFTSMIEEIMKTKRVLDEINSIISWLETDANAALERFRTKPNGTKSCKTLQKEFDAFVSTSIEPKSLRTTELTSSLKTILTDCRFITTDQRAEIDLIERRMTSSFDEYSTTIDVLYQNLTATILCYQLLDEAYEWALDSMKLAANVGKTLSNQKTSPTVEQLTELRDKLIDYLERNPQYDNEKLEKMRSTAKNLNEERLKIQCQAVDVRCSDTEKMLLTQKLRLDEILSSNNIFYDDVDEETNKQQPRRCRIGSGDYEQPSSRFSLTDAAASSSSSSSNNFVHNRRRSFAGSCSTSLHDVGRRCEISNNLTSFQKSSVDLYIDEKSEDTIDGDVITEDLTDQVVASITTTMLRKNIERRAANHSIMERKKIAPVSSDPSGSSTPPQVVPSSSIDSKFRRPFRRFIRRGSLMDVVTFDANHSKSRHPSLDSLSSVGEDSHHSSSLSAKSLPSTPLELSSTDSAPPYPAPLLPPEADDKLRVNTPPPDCSPNVRMQYNVVNELLQTEIAYVRSLQYVIENYIPEMQRTDLPHALRGQRRVIFGNIEKVHEFHVGHFLPDLTRYCLKSTESLGLHVAKCFLRHRLKFQLYALYNKNKPNSDALITECAGVFFRTKQLLLGDKLDLWSYLLKPVQRISKYSLFVQKLIKSCPSDDAEQIESLKSVEEMLMSQLQHGNDLLAMDSIRNCDLNLKEQGRLLRQEEFVVYEGRNGRKCQRRIFLFENLILFAKPVKGRGSVGAAATTSESYRYKHSIKMSDLGMTENVVDSELKFELWFRRHTSDEIYTILAPNMTTKMAWITRVSKLLWQQAHLNRELRISEMSSMGSGSKVCVDLTSEDRIQDRAVSAGLFSKVNRSRVALPSALDVDRFNLTTKRPHSLISVGSSSTSSNNSSVSGTGSGQLSVSATTTPMSLESGFVDLSTLEEYPDDPINDVDTITSSSNHRRSVGVKSSSTSSAL